MIFARKYGIKGIREKSFCDGRIYILPIFIFISLLFFNYNAHFLAPVSYSKQDNGIEYYHWESADERQLVYGVLIFDPKRYQLAFMADEKLSGSLEYHIHWDHKPYRVIRTDGEDSEISYFDLYQRIPSITDHISRFQDINPQRQIRFVAGNGNLFHNAHFVSFINGRLLSAANEDPYQNQKGYTMIVVFDETKISTDENLVQILNVRFVQEGGVTKVINDAGEDITDKIVSATYGQHILKDAAVRDFKQKEVADDLTHQFADIRHLIDVPFIEVGIGVLLGGKQLRGPVGSDALQGKAVDILIDNVIEAKEGFTHSWFNEQMQMFGFSLVDSDPVLPKQYRLVALNKVRIIFKRNRYPFHAIGIKKDGQVVSMSVQCPIFKGGVLVEELSQEMAKLGVVDAVLLDNGSDVFTSYGTDLNASNWSDDDKLRMDFYRIKNDGPQGKDSKAVTSSDRPQGPRNHHITSLVIVSEKMDAGTQKDEGQEEGKKSFLVEIAA